MLDPEAVEQLRNAKNLLAFSGGADSTALFFLLQEQNIAFDIAHVNYHVRPQSDTEAAYAQELADTYAKRCFCFDAERITSDFEQQARHLRYAFFQCLITEQHYSNLITAHQLNDRLEWLLMQLCKGAGAAELCAMSNIEPDVGYTLVRPLLQTPKTALTAYLTEKEIRWFEDESNGDQTIKRNYFRHNFADDLIARYGAGIERSFRYLEKDREILTAQPQINSVGLLDYFQTPPLRRHGIGVIDKQLKRRGYLMRYGEKERLESEDSLVVGRRFAVVITKAYTFIAPYVQTTMHKSFKEACRKIKIDTKLRPFLSLNADAYKTVCLLLDVD